MTYKPEIRVGVDWDGDGFIHLEGVTEGAEVSPIDDTLSQFKYGHGYNSLLEDVTVYTPLVSDDKATMEGVTNMNSSNAMYLGYLQGSKRKIWEKPLPEPMFDGYSLNGIPYDTGSAVSVSTNDLKTFKSGAKNLIDTPTDGFEFTSASLKASQKFVLHEDTALSYIILNMKHSGVAVNGNCSIRIETDSGNKPSGVLAHVDATTGDVNTNTLSTSYTSASFIFLTPPEIDAGTYWFVVSMSAIEFDTVTLGVDDNGGYQEGRMMTYDGSNWSNTFDDLIFDIITYDPNEVLEWEGHTIFKNTTLNSMSVYLGTPTAGLESAFTGIPVVSGRTYVFQCWVRYNSIDGSRDTDPYIAIDVRYNGTGSYNRIVASDANNPLGFIPNKWLLVAVEFTANQTTDVAIEVIFNSNVGKFPQKAITGFMLTEDVALDHSYIPRFNYNGTQPTNWVSPFFYTPEKTYVAEDFNNTLLANTKYDIHFQIKGSSAQTVTYVLRDYEHGTKNYTEFTSTIAVTTSYQTVTIEGATPSSLHSMILTLETLADMTLSVKGVVITESGTGYIQVVSATAIYDNLKNYMLELDWQLGKKEFYENIAYEGTLNITVDNVSKIFSPSNISSPLFGVLKKNLKAIVQMKSPNTGQWVDMWVGWTDDFETVVGTASTRRATIKCKQGVFRLREGNFSYLPKDDQKIGDVIHDIVAFSGWRSAVSPVNWWLSKSRQLGINTFLEPNSSVWATSDEGDFTYDYVGDTWNNKTSVEQALNDVLQAEDATLWVQRDGKLALKTRDEFAYYGSAIMTYDVGVLTKADYHWGKNLINTVEVFVTPKKENQDQVVWRSKRWIRARANGESDPILLTFEREDGSPLTVDNIKLDQEDMTLTVYKYPNKRRRKTVLKPSEVTNTKILNKLTVKNKTDGEGRTIIVIENGYKKDLFVDLQIYGDYIESGEGVSYRFEDLDAIANYESLHKEDIKNPIVETYLQAKSLADLRLIRNAYPNGEFKWIEIITSNETFTNAVALVTIGDVLNLSEDQTGEDNIVHIVVGERAKVRGGVLYMVYDLVRVPPYQFMKFGQNLSPDSIFFV